MTFPEDSVVARSTVWRMFKDAADEDYLVARWASKLGLMHQFYWSAQQATEKYLKAVLLLNDFDLRNHRHRLEPLFNSLSDFAGDLLPSILCPPSVFPEKGEVRRFGFIPFSKFIAHLDGLGNPNIRYRHYSVVSFGYDLHMLDEVCFLIRRLCMPLELPYGPKGESYRTHLSKERRFQPHAHFSFEDMSRSKKHPEILEIIKWRNFSFFWDHAIEVGEIHSARSMQNSAISMYSNVSGEGTEAVRWILSKAMFTSTERQMILNHLNAVEADASLSTSNVTD